MCYHIHSFVTWKDNDVPMEVKWYDSDNAKETLGENV